MTTPLNALQGGLHQTPTPRARPALLLGAGGWLGAAMLAQLLAGGFSRVGAWVERPAQWCGSSHRAVQALSRPQLGQANPDWARACAFIVLERGGLTGQRDAVFGVPQAEDVLSLAHELRTLGASRLVVVLPHLAGSLPSALRHGFADGTEQALSELGFEHLLLVRSSRDAIEPAGLGWMERIARLWWAQLRWMLPDSERPLRSVVLARVAVTAARLLADQPGSSVQVLTQELASQAAHAPEGIEAVLRAAWKLQAAE